MQRQMLKSKIHRATVTGCDVDYVGSITIDPELMQAADLIPTSRCTSGTSPTPRASSPT